VLSRRVLFSTAGYQQDVRNRSYDVSLDDGSFYFVERTSAASHGVVVVRGWLGEVERAIDSD
jgi:hypothetical protein